MTDTCRSPTYRSLPIETASPADGRRRASACLPLASRVLGGVFALVLLSGAAPFAFAPAPQADLNRIYRVNTATGEVGACQYGLKEGTIGVTFCFPAGEGAGPQALGEYGLVPSNHTRESGVFRVNYRTGEISSCYVFNIHVVCTPQLSAADKSGPAAPGQAGTQSQTDISNGNHAPQPPTTPAQ